MLARPAHRPAPGGAHHPRPTTLANWRRRVARAAAASAQSAASVAPPPPRPPPPLAPGALQVLGPPASYDFRADVAEETRRLVAERYPSLLPLAESGVLIVWRRGVAATAQAAAALRGEVAPGADAQPEPEIVLVLGVAHASARSAADVDAVVRAVRPDNVVVELCRSRASLLGGGGEQGGVGGGGRDESGNGNGNSNGNNSNNPVPLGGASSFVGAMSRSLRLGGQAGLVLQLLLGWKAKQALKAAAASAATTGSAAVGGGDSSSPSSSLPSSPSLAGVGAEFRAAATAADAVGAQLVLGDRPIEVTLARAWRASGGLAEKASLLRDLLLSQPPTPAAAAAAAAAAARSASADAAAVDNTDDGGLSDPAAAAARRLARVTVSREAAERFAAAAAAAAAAAGGASPGSLADAAELLRGDDDAVSAALDALTRAHPSLASPLVHERDAYLAWSLRRSKAVRGSRTVVGVVGAAHMRGVAYCLKHGARYRRGCAPGAAAGAGVAAGAEGGSSGDSDDGRSGDAVAQESSAPLSFQDLARPGGPKRTGGERAMRAAADVAIGLAAWMAWDMLF